MGLGDPHAVHPISALTGAGIDALLDELLTLLPEGPAWFPPGMVTDQSLEHRIAELVRERALELTRDEVPHAVAVLVESITPGRGPTVIEAKLICETESQKAILIGRHGAMVKRIGTRGPPRGRAGGGGARSSWSCPSRCGRGGGATPPSSIGSGSERDAIHYTGCGCPRYRLSRSSDRRSMASLDRMINSSRRAMEQRRDARPLEALEDAVRDLDPIRPFTESVVGEEIAFVLRIGDADPTLLAAAATAGVGGLAVPGDSVPAGASRRRGCRCCTRAS